MKEKNYQNLSGILSNTGFWMYGYGNFTLNQGEVSDVLAMLYREEEEELKKFYKKLSHEKGLG